MPLHVFVQAGARSGTCVDGFRAVLQLFTLAAGCEVRELQAPTHEVVCMDGNCQCALLGSEAWSWSDASTGRLLATY